MPQFNQKPVAAAVSQSLQQANFQVERRWNGLCVSCFLALNWPLSLENLGAVKASLLLTYVRQSPAGLSGGLIAPSEAEWSTFARKVLGDLKRDSERMLMSTKWSWLNCRQSSLTRLIYLNRRMRQRSRSPSSRGLRSRVRSTLLSLTLLVRRHLVVMRTAARTWGSSYRIASSSTKRPAPSSSSSTTAERTRLAVPVGGQGYGQQLMRRSKSSAMGITGSRTSRR